MVRDVLFTARFLTTGVSGVLSVGHLTEIEGRLIKQSLYNYYNYRYYT